MNAGALVASLSRLRATLVLSAFALLATQAIAAEPIKIGSVLSLTGAASYLGEPMHQTLQMSVDDANAHGGWLGRPLTLIQYDDESDAGKANGFVKRLVDDDKADVIIAGSTSGSTMAMIPTVQNAGMPFVSLAGSRAIVDPVKKWVFKTPPTDRMLAQRVMEDLKARHIEKLALLTETGAYGQSARRESVDLAKSMGLPVVADETFAPKDSDMTPQLSKIGAAGAQAVFVVGSGAGPAIATRNAAQLGLRLKIYQGGGAASDEFIKLAGRAAEGVYVLGPAFIIVDHLSDSDPQKPVALAYSNAFRKRWNAAPNTFGGSAYDAFMIVRQGVLNAKTTDKEKVRAAMESVHGLIGVQGVFNLSATDHLGLQTESIRVFQVKDGKFVPPENATK